MQMHVQMALATALCMRQDMSNTVRFLAFVLVVRDQLTLWTSDDHASGPARARERNGLAVVAISH